MAKQQNIISQIPRNKDAERMALGAAMLEKSGAAYLMEKCSQEYFVEPHYRVVYKAVKNLFDRDESVDQVTVSSELGRMNSNLGIHYLLEEFNPSVSVQQIFGAVNELQEAYLFRGIHKLSHELNKLALSKTDKARDVIQEAQAKILELASESVSSDLVPISDGLFELSKKIEEAGKHPGAITGIKTGFGTIDRTLNGLNKTLLTILAARPSMGKSSLALCFARNIVLQKRPVAMFSLEMSKQQIQSRLLSLDADIDSYDIMMGNFTEATWQKAGKTLSRLGEWPLYIDDTSGANIEEISAKVKRAVANYGIEVVIIDHMQLIDTRRKFFNRNDQIGYISANCKKIAKDNNVSVIVLSQLNRDLEKRPQKDRKPRLSDLRESGNIEQDADIVMFLMRWEVYGEGNIPGMEISNKGKANLEISKNRDGRAKIDILLNWNAKLTKFSEIENIYAEEEELF